MVEGARGGEGDEIDADFPALAFEVGSDVCRGDGGHAAAHAVAGHDYFAVPGAVHLLLVVDVAVDYSKNWVSDCVPGAMETGMCFAIFTPGYFAVSEVKVGGPIAVGLGSA